MRTARVVLPGLPGIVEAQVLDEGRLRIGGCDYAAHRARFEPAADGLVYGVALNERSAVDALGAALLQAPYKAPPKAPVLYVKPWNTHAAHGAVVPLPAQATQVEVLGALGVVIGRPAARVAASQALQHVRGFTLAADLSLPQQSLYRPPIREKCFDLSCPLGPWIVDLDEIPDPHALVLQVHVAGQLRQRRTLRDLLRPIPELIAEVTAFLTLYPGDVLLAGVPHEAPSARPGEHAAVEISGLGRLEFSIAEAV
jgi:5-oxopent-3-ene-1,2,5-tricarboxylate decarboxylase/2-hydroxyhepta-2,4-diene-1,7-dioate isomerase